MKYRIFFSIIFALAVVSCSKDDGADSFDISISIEPTSLSLHMGETATISATVSPEDLTNKTVLWTTSNTNVVEVRGGVVTAKGIGTATITAKTDTGGKTATCKVTVIPPVLVKSIDLGNTSISLDPKSRSYTFSASVEPDDATDKSLVWESSDENVATISEGVLTIKGKGTTEITATAHDAGGASSKCKVIIVAIPEAVDLGLSVKWASFNIGADDSQDYGEYYAWGELAPKQDYSWTSYRFSSSPYGSFSKYNGTDRKSVLEAEDDIASATLGDGWRLPTREEFNELQNEENCTWTPYTTGNFKGYVITSKKEGYSGNSIFLPAAGYYDGRDLIEPGIVGNYWTSTVAETFQNAWEVGFYSNSICDSYIPRCLGLTIRPVK